MKRGLIVLAIVIAITAVILKGTLYTLQEGKQVIITQFGKPVGDPVFNAGLHIKTPFIQKVTTFEKRILEWDGYPNQIPTKDKKYIWVDTTARWRISDPLRFYQSVFNESGAHSRLDDIIDSAVRDAVTAHNLIEIVRSSNRLIDEIQHDEKDKEFIEEGVLEKVKTGRDKIRLEILENARQLAPQYGIELIDLRIKRVNYVKDVKRKVYERMIAERKRAAEQYRSEGRGISAEVAGRMEKELKGITSGAYKKAQEIKGKADAQATSIYASAYGSDLDFFVFLKTLESYKNTVDENTIIILSTDGDYYQYLKDISPKK